MVGTWETQEQVSCFAALNLVTGQLTTRLLEPPAHSKARTGQSKQRRRQAACAAHLRDIARAYPGRVYPEGVITIGPSRHAACADRLAQRAASVSSPGL
jgi:hypothetical protein